MRYLQQAKDKRANSKQHVGTQTTSPEQQQATRSLPLMGSGSGNVDFTQHDLDSPLVHGGFALSPAQQPFVGYNPQQPFLPDGDGNSTATSVLNTPRIHDIELVGGQSYAQLNGVDLQSLTSAPTQSWETGVTPGPASLDVVAAESHLQAPEQAM